ncbi:tellurium resistance protein [Streptomyces soliscabiei]|uniref:tellurium resistance protein n=1 Tax=Streptomyces soliscabiei TaxID=588897 RepID=UPI0029B32B46|nr:tellurium resistance protein [Streptomyces sp. NY05-11A]MDX2680594.1 tellurium resistance protein [Streptomyces sp. NY05-11A]
MSAPVKSYEEIRKGFLFNEFWGFQKAPTSTNFEKYSKALLVIANSDGELADTERDFVLGLIAGMGGEPALIDELRGYAADEDVHQLLAGDADVRASARALVYDAIRACSADGVLDPRELAKIYEVADRLGVEGKVVDELQGIHAEQRRLVGKLFLTAYPDPAVRPF